MVKFHDLESCKETIFQVMLSNICLRNMIRIKDYIRIRPTENLGIIERNSCI